MKHIESLFERINLEGLNIENTTYLNTKELNEEERNNRALDFLGGFQIMDGEFRMFILEGLGGLGHAMDQFYKANIRTRPNDRKFKMLYNPEVRFKNRLYLDFNVSMKKIRLRERLQRIMGAPDVYIRSKVPEDLYDTLQKFAEIRKIDRAAIVRDFNLYPVTANLLTLERKYGDALSHEDMYGFRLRKKRRMRNMSEVSLTMGSDDCTVEIHSQRSPSKISESQSRTELSQRSRSTIRLGITINAQEEEVEYDDLPSKRNQDTEDRNPSFERSLRERSRGPSKDFIIKNMRSI